MYLNSNAILELAGLLTAVSTLVGAVVTIYKVVERDKRQSEEIKDLKEEQTVICYGVLCCLKGLKEQGCNGPVTEALHHMEKHLNKAAHT